MMSVLYILISVDWEGRSLLPENLQAMRAFRQSHPEVPMQHFLNAAYYTKREADPNCFTRQIGEVLLPEDDHGLHIHAWHSLLAQADVAPRTTPVMIEPTAGIFKERNVADHEFFTGDDGYSVPLQVFSRQEVRRLLATSVEILTQQGRPRAFRAGGWMANQAVLSALVDEGFNMDASALNVRLVIPRLTQTPLLRYVYELWPHINDMSQPYKLETRAGELWQVPNNGCLADYASANDMMTLFDQHLALLDAFPEQDRLLSIGFHQETANKYLGRIDDVVRTINKRCSEEAITVKFISSPMAYLATLENE